MNSWRPFPLLRLVFPFTAGIIAEGIPWWPLGQRWWIPAVMAVMLAASQVFTVVVRNYRLRWVSGLIFSLFLLLSGYGIAWHHRSANDPCYLGNQKEGTFLAMVTEPPAIRKSGMKAAISVRYHLGHGKWQRSRGNAIAYLAMGESVRPLSYGDHVVMRARFTGISDNSNPYTFNYSRYLQDKDITHRIYAEPYSWKRIGVRESMPVRKTAFRVRDRLLNILRENHVEGKEFAVAAALLLGYVDDLDPELRSDYSATGAMHILSVSGMHVGIIYIFLEFILGFLNRRKAGRFVKAVLLLLFIWFYAMLTGLSPCVLRSAAMLSLPIIGKSMDRSPNMFNIIAASVIFILILDPLLVLDIGFQLSYLAVIGIVVLYKPVYDLYVTSAWLPDKIWSVIAVSVAAQIATLPITLYTFHQFPNYFILTNIFVVPLSSLIIYTGILALAAGTIPVISVLFAKVLVFLVWSLNSVIHFIEQLPYSAIHGVFISAPEMMLLYLVIGALFLFLTLKRIWYLYTVLIAAILLAGCSLGYKLNQLRSSRMIIFNSRNEALYMFTNQDKAVFLYDGTGNGGGISGKPGRDLAVVEKKAFGIRFSREFWSAGGRLQGEIAKSFVPLAASNNFIRFNGCRIKILDRPIPKGFNGRADVDLLILSGNPKISIGDAVRVFHPGQIIIDGTNSRYRTTKWMDEAAVAGVRCHAVTEHGAFQKEF